MPAHIKGLYPARFKTVVGIAAGLGLQIKKNACNRYNEGSHMYWGTLFGARVLVELFISADNHTSLWVFSGWGDGISSDQAILAIVHQDETESIRYGDQFTPIPGTDYAFHQRIGGRFADAQ